MSSTTPELNRELLEELRWDERGRAENLIIRAGAGAGKTTELVHRVLSLMIRFRRHEGRFPRLVITTFTRKATQELRERLLLQALQLGDPEVLRYLQQSRSLQISTIHGSLRRFLSSFGSTRGLDPDFGIMDSLEDSRLRKRCLRGLLEESPERMVQFESLLEDWNLKDFWTAFETWNELRLLHPQVQAETAEEISRDLQGRLLGLEEKTREFLRQSASQKLTDPWKKLVGQFEEILRQLALHPASATGPRREVWQNFRSERVVVRKSSALSDDFVDFKKEIFEDWDELQDEVFDPSFAEIYARNLRAFVPLCETLAERLEAEKKRRSQLSLLDLELWTLRILRAHPETGEQFAQMWDYWMIDEFQDTSPLQIEILKGLVGGRPEFIVGDPQQSIYLFRGARAEVFFEKEKQIKAAGGRHLLLMRNYRSAMRLMSFLNKFLVEFNSAQFQPMEIGSQTPDWNGPQALFWQTPSRLPEDPVDPVVNALVARVQELLRQGVSPEKICVLGRGNQSLHEFCQRAREAGLDLHFSGSAGFAERREVRDALSFLRFFVSPHDNLNLMTLLRAPWFQVEDSELQKIGHAGDLSFWRRALDLRSQGQLSAQTEAVLELLVSSLERARETSVSRTWLRVLLDQGFVDDSRLFDSSGQRESHFWRLVSDLQFQEREVGFNILKWIEKVEIGQVTDEVADAEAPAVIEPARIQVMTIHASKGLQFDHVLVGWAGQISIKAQSEIVVYDEKSGRFSLGVKGLPSGKLVNSLWGTTQSQTFKKREIEEFDRFLYVALTRAKVSVSLIWQSEKSSSWMGRRPLWARLPEGVHDLEGFQVESRLGAPQVEIWSAAERKGHLVRPPWKLLMEAPSRRQVQESHQLEWRRFERIQRGIEIHRSLELLKMNWGSDASAEILDLKSRLESFREVDLRRLIESGYVEWAFLVKRPPSGEGQSLWTSGRIDLWGELAGEVWIVDYKTGSSKSREKAIEQLKFYAWTLSRLGRIPAGAKVRLLPLFLFEEGSFSELAPPQEELDLWVRELENVRASALD